jgi:hypothetical protein
MRTFDQFKNEKWERDFRTHPANSYLEGVFIETRPDPDILYALINFSCHLPYAALTILCSKDNINNIKTIIGNGTNIKVSLLEMDSQFTIEKFNNLLTTPRFWNQFKSERVIFFMTDTGIRKNDVLRFMKYDWVGAPWELPIDDPRVFQGNGAFSIRNPKILKQICEKFKRGNLNEDVFFAKTLAISIRNASLPTLEIASKFSSENIISPDAMGFHDVQRFTKESDVVWGGHEGPTRRLLHIDSARADDTDITDFIKIGIGAKGLRIGAGTLVRPGAKKLIIDGKIWQLDNGFVKDEIFLTVNSFPSAYSPMYSPLSSRLI